SRNETIAKHVANNLKNIIKHLIALILFLVSFTGTAQIFASKMDSIINLRISELKNDSITEIGYTKITCINYGIFQKGYLIWNDKSKTFLQKFEEKRNPPVAVFQPINITDTVFFPFYNINKKLLKTEDVKPFSYHPEPDKTYTVSSSHSCYRFFIIKSVNEEFIKGFDYYDLKESKENNNGQEPTKNIYFEKNNNLMLIQWDKIMKEFTENLESENIFEQIKTE
ncbi:hypothetical protein LRR18_16425, partial [Mangrovimonas sp. AS39]|uniref:hypothetical protein n=1 Tax=Mangrovimonas futianensis TaxID=2895523 RepID=UPI001E2A30E4